MAMGRDEARKVQAKIPEIEHLFIYADEEGKFCTDFSEGFQKYQIPESPI